MLNEKTSKFDSDFEEISYLKDFPDLFKTEVNSFMEIQSNADDVLPENFSRLEADPQNEDVVNGESDPFSPKSVLEPSNLFNGNEPVKKRINNQMHRRAVNRISKEIKKCSKEYFNRVFQKEKKNVLFAARQVSFANLEPSCTSDARIFLQLGIG